MAKQQSFWLTGLVPATFTPFDEQGEVDFPKFEPYCEFLLKNGIKAVYVNGTTSEGKSLTMDERKKIAEKWMSVSKGRLKIVLQIGALNLRDGKELAKHAAEIGVDAIATLPSLFFKPQDIDSLITYCSSIASAAPNVPIYYYHLPMMTGVEINMEDFLTRAKEEIPNLVGVKFSSKDLVDMIGCVFAENGKYNVLYGTDAQLMAGFVTGCHGAVGSTFNFMPGVYHRMMDYLEKGDIVNARKEQINSQRMYRLFLKYGKPLGNHLVAQKYILSFLGLDMGPPREPMRAMKEDERNRFYDEIKALGFFDWEAVQTI